MSEQEVILEDKKLKKKLWQQIIDAAKEALEKNDNTKKGIIKKTAELLEQSGMPLEMICATVTRELNGFASKNYITECLDSKYKDMTQSHPIPRTKPKVEDEDKVGNVTLPDNTNNIEQNSTSPVQEQVNEWYEQTRNSLTEENNNIEKPEDQTVNQVKESQQQTEEQIQLEEEEENELEQPLELEIIRPEDYIIQDLPKYSSQLKDRIIIYLDEQVKKLTKNNQN